MEWTPRRAAWFAITEKFLEGKRTIVFQQHPAGRGSALQAKNNVQYPPHFTKLLWR